VDYACNPSYLEAEKGRIVVPGQKDIQDPISIEKSWVQWFMPVIPVTWKA
jgi:hypothetical protein